VVAEVRVHLRDAQLLAEVLGVLVDGEARREGRDLDQDAARLAPARSGGACSRREVPGIRGELVAPPA